MKFCISSGHGKYIRGAAGSPIPPYLDEVDQARRVVEEVARVLRSDGDVVLTFHDDVSTTQSQNLDRIVDWHNSQSRDWDVSVHFNAYQTTTKAMGTEVLFVSSTGEAMAREVCDAICENGFINRGPKRRTDLAFLNGTEMPAILIETAFCDSKADCDLYNAKFADVCHSIAEGLAGHPICELEPGEPEPEPMPEGVAKAPDIMMRLMRDFGLTDFQAGGVLGNIGHECAWFTIWQEGGKEPPEGGWGWCQWTGSRREDFYDWIEAEDFDDKSDEGNYGFLAHELNTTEKNALAALKETTTLAEATEVFMVKFERPGVPHLDRRQDCAVQAMDEWQDQMLTW